MYKRTKIVCTMGPACDSDETIREMIKAGMNVARFNFPHGSCGAHHGGIARVRRLSKELGRPVGILLDTHHPGGCEAFDGRLRFGPFEQRGVDVSPVDHGIGVAKALAKGFLCGDAAHQVCVQRVVHHHFVGVHRAAARLLTETQGVERGKGIGAELDTRADFTQLGCLLQHLDRITLARQRQSCGHAANAATGDQHLFFHGAIVNCARWRAFVLRQR